MYGENLDETLSNLFLYKDDINKITNDLNIPTRLFVATIATERKLNYNFVDKKMDSFLGNAGRDNSIGFCQIKISATRWVLNNLRQSDSQYYLGVKYENYLPQLSTNRELVNLLQDPIKNIKVASAYSAMILRRWQNEGFDVVLKPEIFASLYNLGPYYKGKERLPNKNPIPIKFGIKAKEIYNLKALDTYGIKAESNRNSNYSKLQVPIWIVILGFIIIIPIIRFTIRNV